MFFEKPKMVLWHSLRNPPFGTFIFKSIEFGILVELINFFLINPQSYDNKERNSCWLCVYFSVEMLNRMTSERKSLSKFEVKKTGSLLLCVCVRGNIKAKYNQSFTHTNPMSQNHKHTSNKTSPALVGIIPCVYLWVFATWKGAEILYIYSLFSLSA